MTKKSENESMSELHNFKVGDEMYRTMINTKYANRKPYQTPNPKLVTSFMPGSIQEVFVSKGDLVEEGQKLCTLDAMKMKNVIFSPLKGTIKSVNVTPGKMVPKNCILVEIE